MPIIIVDFKVEPKKSKNSSSILEKAEQLSLSLLLSYNYFLIESLARNDSVPKDVPSRWTESVNEILRYARHSYLASFQDEIVDNRRRIYISALFGVLFVSTRLYIPRALAISRAREFSSVHPAFKAGSAGIVKLVFQIVLQGTFSPPQKKYQVAVKNSREA